MKFREQRETVAPPIARPPEQVVAEPPTEHVSSVFERRQAPGQLPEFRSTVTVVRGGEVVVTATQWLPLERIVSRLAVQRGVERDALLRWLGPGGGVR